MHLYFLYLLSRLLKLFCEIHATGAKTTSFQRSFTQGHTLYQFFEYFESHIDRQSLREAQTAFAYFLLFVCLFVWKGVSCSQLVLDSPQHWHYRYASPYLATCKYWNLVTLIIVWSKFVVFQVFYENTNNQLCRHLQNISNELISLFLKINTSSGSYFDLAI